jgi:two-component system, sensor histidine kinase
VSDGEDLTLDSRVLVLAPTSKDASITRSLLSPAGIDCRICGSFEELLAELQRGAAAIVVPEEAVTAARNATLSGILAQQPPWSDLPVLVLTQHGADSVLVRDAIKTLGNVTILERPLRAVTLLTAVRTAVRARDRQYQIRGHLAAHRRDQEFLHLADRRKDEFLATLGHELRNPLAPLVTGLQLLNKSPIADPAARRVMAVMDRQIAHLVRLVDDLLEVSRITRGLIDVRREPVDLGSLMQSAIDTSRPIIDRAGHQLTVEVPREPITVSGDPVRLIQVFSNLLTNAAKYTNAGGHITFGARTEHQHAVIVVRDNGIGIPADQLASVFEMFTQIDRVNKRTQGGLGIGLTLVRSLVEMHGGHVEARSDGLGKGSEFLVTLPVLRERAAARGRTDVPRQFPPTRVLIVDDNQDAADTLAALLTALGVSVSAAYNGRAALEALDSFHADAVLLDLGMPEMDGYEVARRIRATSRHDDVLLIALTGWGQECDHARSHAAGFDHHLVKPPDVNTLRRLLTRPRSGKPGEARRQRRAVGSS